MIPWIRKLEHGASLTDEDRQTLMAVTTRPRRVAARTDIISEGDEPWDVHLLMEGFACR